MSLDWSAAEVTDGVLTVPLAGKRPKGWKQTFQTTVKLLGGGDWDDVELKSGKVRVTGVSPGVEERLRHFLEGAVQQADAKHKPPEDEADEPDSGEGEDSDDPDADDPDAELTARFRAFSD